VKAFEVFVNGRRVCMAGVGPDGVLSAILDWVGGGPRHPAEGSFDLHVGGLDSRTDEHVDWSVPEVGVGDEVTIRIVETEDIDPEARRRKADRQQGEG
jgi:hypothetical protein